MSLTEVWPEVQALSRLDKIRLIRLLAQELEGDESGLVEAEASYPVWSPDRAFSAAAALLQALAEEKTQPGPRRRSSFPMSRASQRSALPAWRRCCP